MSKMAKLEYSVYHFPSDSAGSVNITDSVDMMNDGGINTDASTFTISVSNKDGKYKDDLTYGDKIKIEAGYDGSKDMLIYATIEEEEYTIDRSRIVKIIKGAGPTRDLQNFPVVQTIDSAKSYVAGGVTYNSSNMKSSSFVKIIVDGQLNRGDTKYGFNTFVDPDDECKLWTTQLDADYFKVWTNKKINEVFDEVRSNKYTGNGDYDFYIDAENEVHFEPTGKITSEYPLIAGSNCLSIKVGRDIRPKFTAVRVFLGNDDNDNAVYTVAYNNDGLIQYGQKWSYLNWGQYFANIKKSYPLLNNSELVNKTKEAGDAAANDYVTRQGLPQWEAKVTMRGNDNYNITSGQSVPLYFPEASDTLNPSNNMILKSVKHQINNSGWITIVDLEESIGEVFS